MLIITIPNFEAAMKNTYIFASDQNYKARSRLEKLIMHEVDSIKLIELCLENVKTASIRDRLTKMIDECENNQHDLETILKNSYGLDVLIKPSTQQADTKGLLTEGYAVFKGGLMEKGALKILHDKMKNISSAYEEALKNIQTNEEKIIIQRIVEGRRKFLHYLELCLSQCVVKEN